MQKTPYVFPIIGGRKVEHLHANIEALSISLSAEQIHVLESVLPFDIGFPVKLLVNNSCAPFDSEADTFYDLRAMVPSITPCKPQRATSLGGLVRRLFVLLPSNEIIMEGLSSHEGKEDDGR